MTQKRRVGRPSSGEIIRDHQVAFFLREHDAQYWADLAKKLRFVSRSQLFTAIAEILQAGGCSTFTFLKLGMMIQKRAEETGAAKNAALMNPFKSLPPLPLIEEPTEEEFNKALQEIKNERLKVA